MGFITPQHLTDSLPYHWFVGIDWGSQTHQVCVLDRTRRCVAEREVHHDGLSRAQFATWLSELSAGEPTQVAVAIEMPHGAMVEMLDVRFISSLPVMQGNVYKAWVDSKPVQMVRAGD